MMGCLEETLTDGKKLGGLSPLSPPLSTALLLFEPNVFTL